METRQRERLMRWLKQYPWLWTIKSFWLDTPIRAERVKGSARDFTLALLGDCQYYLYLEGEFGPQVFKSLLNGDGRLANTIIHAAQNERDVKALAVLRHHPVTPSITIYKPPQNGWNGLFKRAWDLLH